MVLFLNNKDQEKSINANDAINALENGLKEFALGNGVRRPRFDMFIPTSFPEKYFCFSSMEGGIRNPGYYAIRIKPDIMSWSGAKGQSRRMTYNTKPGKYGGLVFLFKVEDASLVSIMNDGFIQHLRVASTASLGAKYLSTPEASVAGILGSGGMAHSFAAGFSAVRKLRKIKIFSPNKEHAKAFAKYITMDLGIVSEVMDTPEEAIRGSHIVASCTNSMEPTLKGEWLDPGSYVTVVARRELGDDVLKRISKLGLLVNRRPLTVSGYFDEDFAIRAHVMSYAAGSDLERSKIPVQKPVSDLFNATYVDCIDWKTGRIFKRESEDEITMLSHESHGTKYSDAGASEGIQGIQFSSIGGKIYENAIKNGIGQELPSEMFIQDIPT